MESLNRAKASDCTVTGTATGAPLEELELLELDELLEDELLLDELELLLEELLLLEEVLELLVLELAELVLLDALEELLELLEVEELLVELELLEELEVAPEDDELELGSSSPWVTNKPSPPQAVRAASTRLKVNERRDFFAELRNPDGYMKNTPHKCVIRVQINILG